jgi:hypothetical protein
MMPEYSNDDPPEWLPPDLFALIEDGRYVYYATDIESATVVGWTNCAFNASDLARRYNLPVYRYDGKLICGRQGK